MNRKERRLALRTALMARIDDVTVVKDFAASLEAPRPVRSRMHWVVSELLQRPRCSSF